jgi:hypothetical protein
MITDIDDWQIEDKIAAARMHKLYPKVDDYIEAMGYDEPDNGLPNCIAEGKLAHKKAKYLYNHLSKVFTDEELQVMSILIDR